MSNLVGACVKKTRNFLGILRRSTPGVGVVRGRGRRMQATYLPAGCLRRHHEALNYLKARQVIRMVLNIKTSQKSRIEETCKENLGTARGPRKSLGLGGFTPVRVGQNSALAAKKKEKLFDETPEPSLIALPRKQESKFVLRVGGGAHNGVKRRKEEKQQASPNTDPAETMTTQTRTDKKGAAKETFHVSFGVQILN